MANQYTKLRIVQVVNRTTEPKNVIWDGVPHVIPAGYKLVPSLDAEGNERVAADKTPIMQVVGAGPNGEPLTHTMEYYAAEAAKRQHPIMGTLDPESHLDYETYIGVVDWDDDISYAPPSAAIELLDRSLLPAARQHVQHQYVAGARKDSKQRRKRRRIYVEQAGAAVPNPGGIRGEYAGGADFTR